MRNITFTCLLLSLWAPARFSAQTLQPPCNLQVFVQLSICIDIPCLSFAALPSNGTGPYTYSWSTGSNAQTIVFAPPYPSCPIVTVTDASGCQTIAAPGAYVGAAVQSGFLMPDTVAVSGGTASFDVSGNDHALAAGYRVVQPPTHGTLTLDASGAGTYQPDAGWCGPDYFRYTATDTSNCALAPATHVVLHPQPCAELFVLRRACSGVCNGSAWFYENNALPGPLSYTWSNGVTEAKNNTLCAGPVGLTVTDGAGMQHVYTADIPAGGFSASISGPLEICRNDQFVLKAQVDNPSGSQITYEWSGPGVWSGLVFNQEIKLGISGIYDTVTYLPYRLIARSADGCVDSVFHAVKMYKAVILNGISTAQSTFCPGDSLRLWANPTGGEPPYSYYWVGPSGIQSNYPQLIWPGVSAADGGSYRLTVRDVNGCRNTQTRNITVRDSCPYTIVVNTNSQPYCKGSTIRLWYGLGNAGSWVVPDLVEWTGPNNFHATGLEVLLPDADPSMSGLYQATVHMDGLVLSGEKDVQVSGFESQITGVSLVSTPSSCVAPYNGVIQVSMSTPPPYTVTSSWGLSTNAGTNPFQVFGVPASDFHTLRVKTNSCVVEQLLDIPSPNPPAIDITPISCAGYDGAIEVSSPNTLQVSWSVNGLTLPAGNSHSGLAAGAYLLSIKDQLTKCLFKDTVRLEEYLSFAVLAQDTPDCQSADGTLLVVPDAGALPPFNFGWSNQFSGNPATGLTQGWYSVTVTDGAGCQNHKNAFLPASEPCFALLRGRVRIKEDCQCVPGGTDYFFPSAMVCARTGSRTECAFTDFAGNYELPLLDTGQYLVWVRAYHPYFEPVCDSLTVDLSSATGTVSGQDFYLCGPPATDLRAAVFCGTARPGFPETISIELHNRGTVKADSSLLRVYLDPALDVQQFTPQPFNYDQNSGVVTWIVNALQVFENSKFTIKALVTAPLGDTIEVSAQVTTKNTDLEPADNIAYCFSPVTGSYDPNDKQVYPPGVGSAGHISPADSLLTYTIRFQNTGTDTAFTVIVRDTLDAAVFDVSGIEPVQSSHPYRLRIEDGHILVFTFDPINLPDSNRTVAGSQGFVQFQIPLKPQLREGAVIRNSAAIYFDYNLPVITNATQNTLTAIADTDPVLPGLRLAPNPASRQAWAYVSLPVPGRFLRLRLYDLSGRFVRNLYGSSSPVQGVVQIPIEWDGVPAGMYLVRVETDYGTAVAKLVLIP